jgi:hypothetical protein
MSSVIKLGQKDLNILFNVFSDNLITKIRMQNKIKISNAGDGFYDFMT